MKFFKLGFLFVREIYTIVRFLLCLLGFHGASEIAYTIDDEEIKVCRNCAKDVE